jgi:hypothetical protein
MCETISQTRPNPPLLSDAELAVRRAQAAITLLVAAASLTSFAETYRALFDWSGHHGVHGLWAVVWPLQVDVFIAVGELALFVGLADQWKRRRRIAA